MLLLAMMAFFEPNQGQAPQPAKFILPAASGRVAFEPTRAVFTLGNQRVAMNLGQSREPRAEQPHPSATNYIGPRLNLARVPHFARLRYTDVRPGIDLVFYTNAKGVMEFDFIAAPGSDPSSIELTFDGAKPRLEAGAIVAGPITLRPPALYQETTPVAGAFKLSGNALRFAIGPHDPSKPLTIDPELRYSSYFGSVGGSSGEAMKIDKDGNVYITGTMSSNTFPALNSVQDVFAGSNELFVSKFSPSGQLIYSSFIGSWGDDRGAAITVDDDGFAYVAGFTSSTDFPMVNAIQPNFAGGAVVNGGDMIVLKLSPDGSKLIFSTYYGGNLDEYPRAIALDADRNIVVTGTTLSPDYPVVNALQPQIKGSQRDLYITKFTNDGQQVLFSTFLGGTLADEPFGLAIDKDSNIFITGMTVSTDFPLKNPVQARFGTGAHDVFLLKLAADGSELLFSTYYGGTGDDVGRAIALDSQGNPVVVGYSSNTVYPTKNRFRASGGGRDAVITKFSNDGSQVVFSTYLGGNNTDDAFGVAIDADDNVTVMGTTISFDFPMSSPFQPAIVNCKVSPCVVDLFVSKLKAAGNAFIYSSYLGGTAAEAPKAMASDPDGAVWITGNTTSTNFPVVSALQEKNTGGGAAVAFLTRIVQ